MKKHANTRKTKTSPMESDFTKPEVEAALLLIQLSSDSDHGRHCSLKSGDDDFHVLIKDLQKNKKKNKGGIQQQQSQQSSRCTNYSNNSTNHSEVTSAMSATTVAKIFFEKDRDDNNNNHDDKDNVAFGPRRKIKKFRSVDELYRLTMPF